ncbi:hypothetical protein G9A89_018151 [Geosiphon pyriformis]|nr:hypothetical protein G9A89_018151 [Geosiphon pyriformis]
MLTENLMANLVNFSNAGRVLDRHGFIDVYTDGSVRNLGFIDAYGGTTAYFSKINISVGIKIIGLLSSILVKLQAIALALEYISVSSTVTLFINSQALLDICMFDVDMSGLNFCFKKHSGIIENEQNACYFVRSLFNTVNFVSWKSKCAVCFINMGIVGNINTTKTFSYSSIVCIKCKMVKDSDHLFLCTHNDNAKKNLLSNIKVKWCKLVAEASSNLYILLVKRFVLRSWMTDTVHYFSSVTSGNLIVKLVCSIAKSHKSSIWLSVVKLKVFYKKHNLLLCNKSIVPLVTGLSNFWAVELSAALVSG